MSAAPSAVDVSDATFDGIADAMANLLLSPPAFESVDGKPKCGFTLAGKPGIQLCDGDGAHFELRIGPDYKRNGKKAPSISHTYSPITIDIFKCKKATFHLARKLTLPPLPGGGDAPNDSGLPRLSLIHI